MKQLLLDIRTRLRAKLTTIEDDSIYISLEPLLFISPPQVWIQDGEIDFDHGPTIINRQKTIFRVDITAFAALPRTDTPEASLLGDSTNQGAVEIVADIHTALNRGGSDSWKPSAVAPAQYLPPTPVSESRAAYIAVKEPGNDTEVQPWGVGKRVTYRFLREQKVF